MPHPTRQAIIRWAAAVLLVMVVGYFGTYFGIADRRDSPPDGYPTTVSEFRKPIPLALFVPLAMVEAAVRQREVSLWWGLEEHGDYWTCEPGRVPRKYLVEPYELGTRLK